MVHARLTDLDHDIDITDFNVLASNFSPKLEMEGPVVTYKTVRQGDFNGDWKIDITDFNTLSDNFAPSGYTAPFASALSSIPEPSALTLAAILAALIAVTLTPRTK